MNIDPLSVGNELVIARAQYFRMNDVLSKHLDNIDKMEEEGTLPLDDEGNPVDASTLRDRYIFGYATRLRELELSISSMVKQEQKRYIELRKQEFAELMQPHLLPAEESSIVIEMLSLRPKKQWTALETCHQIELMGARPPAMLLHEAKIELSNFEPEVIEEGVSEDELDEITAAYMAEQQEQEHLWLPEREKEVALRIKEAEDIENGIIPNLSPSQIINEATTAQAYDELDEVVAGFDDISSFEVLGGETTN